MTGNIERLYEPLKINDLKKLKYLGFREHEEFFKRNPHLKEAYYNSLIGIVLCQGAASHYLNPKVGIKDFDIWHFYVEDENINFPYRAHRRIENGYKGRPIDFLKRTIPKSVYQLYSNDPGEVIIRYLLERNTKTKNLLLKKAVIGLFPDNIFGKVLWKGDL
ncbi:hypothetical protein [Hydrogenivirga sp. 128-5-R1-1]|uniref:hypothetical protein n=1 Tax=Hydrogenivirga sp. 128-5-R1-1 TaxID=392423 RepID=UPI00015F36EC|nr:hypothetical protein [Hydrogenivirga sp. 128-5-R1-1]EDP76478.1 hypothetical protein HG1285_02688 [Hydrogenivirga sp. 128-5-R1-1]